MRMIHLRFEDAGVFPDQSMLLGKQKKLARKHKNWAYSEIEKKYVLQSLGSKNFMNPITTNIVANVLRALSNDIPVPTLKPSSIAKNPIFEELASNAYVRYDTPMADENGKPMFLEYITTNKSHVKDSHQRATQCFELFDNSILEIGGCYNWQYFFQTFDNNNPINKDTIISLIGEILGICKVNERLTFDEMIKELSRYWANIDFKRKVLDFFKDNYTTNAINESWAHVLFGCHYDAKMHSLKTDMTKSNNTTHKAKTPLLYTRGILTVDDFLTNNIKKT